MKKPTTIESSVLRREGPPLSPHRFRHRRGSPGHRHFPHQRFSSSCASFVQSTVTIDKSKHVTRTARSHEEKRRTCASVKFGDGAVTCAMCSVCHKHFTFLPLDELDEVLTYIQRQFAGEEFLSCFWICSRVNALVISEMIPISGPKRSPGITI